MKSSFLLAGGTLALVAALAACGGGSRALLPQSGAALAPSLQAASVPQAAPTLLPVDFKLSSASISKGSKSVTITLVKVNGKKPPKSVPKTKSSNLTKCTKGCTVAGPSSPAGKDEYSVTIIDQPAGKKGNTLATGSVTGTVKSGKKPTTIKVTVPKVPAFLTFGTVPSATAGTVLAATTLPLTVTDADKNPIAGSYSTPVTVSDSDTSSITQGSYLSVNGAAASRSVSSSKSTDKLTIGYGGLAMSAVTLTASASKVTSATATFAPTNGAIQYSGPLVNGSPEIDLYSTTGVNPGFSASFTRAQPGWNDGSFANAFTYALGGTNNNCTSYVVSPASGTASTYTVSVGSSPSAGTCTLTATGGVSLTLNVLLTYTTSGIGINTRHARPLRVRP
jgi:hypothetical protein